MIGVWLKAAWLMASGFFQTRLGRWLLVAGACLALILGFGRWQFSRGEAHQREIYAAQLKKARAVVVKKEAKAAAINDGIVKDLGKRQIEIRTVTQTLIKEVPHYVTVASDAHCVIPVGFISLWNQAASGGQAGVPAAPGGSVEAPTGLQLSSLLAADASNFGTAYLWRAEALSWRDWYAKQSAEWVKP